MWIVYILGAFLIILIILVRANYTYENFIKKKPTTECPNCYHITPRIENGRHKCIECQFEFDIDKIGVAQKYLIRGVIANGILGTFFSVALYFFVIEKFYPSKTIEILNLAYCLLFLYMIFTSFNHFIKGIRGNIFYRKQNK